MDEQVLKNSNDAQNYERDDILAQTRGKADQINSEIEEMRKKGFDNGYIDEYKQQKTEELAFDHYNRVYAQKKKVEAALDESIEKWKEARDRYPEKSLVQFQREQAEIDGMDDEELRAEARRYWQDGEDMEPERLDLIARRLRGIDGGDYKQLRASMKERRASEPWLREPKIGELERRRQVLASQNLGEVRYRIGEKENQYQKAKISDFIID
jgi:hypothetical protein